MSHYFKYFQSSLDIHHKNLQLEANLMNLFRKRNLVLENLI